MAIQRAESPLPWLGYRAAPPAALGVRLFGAPGAVVQASAPPLAAPYQTTYPSPVRRMPTRNPSLLVEPPRGRPTRSKPQLRPRPTSMPSFMARSRSAQGGSEPSTIPKEGASGCSSLPARNRRRVAHTT